MSRLRAKPPKQELDESLDTLKAMKEDLYNLFLSNQQVQTALNLGPVPVVVVGTQVAQTGRILGYTNGGIVPAMLEPGEAFFPTMNMSQQHALTAMNAAFPRFGGGIVQGVGDGDTVPAFLPVGSGILNRNATRALQGAQRVQVGPGPRCPVRVDNGTILELLTVIHPQRSLCAWTMQYYHRIPPKSGSCSHPRAQQRDRMIPLLCLPPT
jgi:hypothetical protein